MSFMQFDTTAHRKSIATNYQSMNENNDDREDTDVCDQIQSLAITSVPESTGVTTFVQEACTAISAVDVSYSKTFYPVQNELQDVREYFRRPVCIRSNTIGTTRARQWVQNGTMATYLGFWNDAQGRLRGAYGIRATMVLTLQVAATPFHQGLTCLSAQYGYQTGSTGIYDRSKDSCTSTNLPSVVLDLSVDTSVQLKIPYLSVSEYSDIRGTMAETSYVQVALNNLCAVPTVAGMGSPSYQVYLHLEDIELFGATPQATTNVALTAGRKLSPVTEEFEKDSHPFSSALYASSRAVNFIAKGVPSISSIGGPVAWALGKAAGVVRYFGYGKPAVTEPVMRIFRQDNVGEFNTDVATSTMVLAATAANTTSINTSVGYSDVDEMSLKYVTSRWGQINVFDISNATSAGTLIYGTPICPLAFWFRSRAGVPAANKFLYPYGTATSNSVQPSHIMFAAMSFKQWRGGLKFRFTFAKTKMHAGRVMVAFNPYQLTTLDSTKMYAPTNVDIPTYGTAGADPFGYSAIFDLKDSNVFEFKVPYVSPIPYANLSTYTGALAMYVVNPLISSSVVSSTISCIVEVAGDVDFELANPAGIMMPVHNSGTIALTAGRVLSEAPEILNQCTVGESVNSVKQLIAIPHVSSAYDVSPPSVIVPPWYYQPRFSVLTPPTNTFDPLSFSYGGNWASCYGFMKGGTDVHCYSQIGACTFGIVQVPVPGAYTLPNFAPDNRGASNAPTMVTAQNSLHARLPGFFPTARAHTWIANTLVAAGSNWANNPWSSTTSVTPFDGVQALYSVTAQISALYTGDPSYYMNRNASDDAQLAMYIGPPPVFTPASGLNAPFDRGGLYMSFT